MKQFKYVAGMIILSAIISCQSGNNNPKSVDKSGHQVEVQEVIQATSYTYINVKEGGIAYWMAIPKMDVREGELYVYQSGLEMTDFESKDLERTFDKILFVERIKKVPGSGPEGMDVKTIHSMMPKLPKAKISIQHAEGSTPVSDLFENPEDFKDKEVQVSGMIVKVNTGIMGKNWLHLQDGTEFDGKYDLVLTTDQDIEVGNVLTLKGILRTDMDFGSGYKYEIIVEETEVVE